MSHKLTREQHWDTGCDRLKGMGYEKNSTSTGEWPSVTLNANRITRYLLTNCLVQFYSVNTPKLPRVKEMVRLETEQTRCEHVGLRDNRHLPFRPMWDSVRTSHCWVRTGDLSVTGVVVIVRPKKNLTVWSCQRITDLTVKRTLTILTLAK